MELRTFDYYYVVSIDGRDGSHMWVNNERHWKSKETGLIEVTQIDFSRKVPLLIEQLEVAKAISRSINGRVRRVAVGEVISDAVDL